MLENRILGKICEYLKLFGFTSINETSVNREWNEVRLQATGEVDLVPVWKEMEEGKSTRNGCRLGEVDHCGDAEQLQPTNISIKPAVLSQSHTNGTLGRKEVLGGKKKKG